MSGTVCTLGHLNWPYLFQAGKFNTIPTLINLVAAFTSVGLVRICDQAKDNKNVFFLFAVSFDYTLCYLCRQGTVLCDIILLNFLKGAEQYKAKKFEEVMHVLIMHFDYQYIQTLMAAWPSPKSPGKLSCKIFLTDFPRCFVHPGVGGSDRSIPCSEPRQPAVT